MVNRIINSINARFFQPWILNNYEKTNYGKKLRKLKNKYIGQRCFFVGNGPSLLVEDLNKLIENDEITFGFNRIYNIFDQTKWRPSFYVSQDEKILLGCKDIVSKLKLKYKFIPINCKWYHDIEIENAIYFNMKAPRHENYKPLDFSNEIDKCMYQANTGMYTATQLAAYMGFKEIYLIGVDHYFQISINNNGEIIIDDTVKDYFTEKYNEDKNKLDIPNVERSTLTYIAMKEQCEIIGIKVYNATRGGKLEVFERVEFGQLFNK